MDQYFLSRVIAYADLHGFSDAPTSLGFGGLSLVRAYRPSELMNTLYVPLLCFVLQGQKETRFGTRTVRFAAGDTLIVSINMPTVSQVTVASSEKPFVSLAIEIDLDIIRSLQVELELTGADTTREATIAAGACSDALAQAIQRLFDLLERPVAEKNIMAPLLLREIHFRMLLEGHSGMLRQLARPDSHESRINRAILKLQNDFSEPISVEDLAGLAGMSTSGFHQHFKAITAKTPLQYLKDMRLLIAQQRILSSVEPVSLIGYQVGYESAAHFSRDYDRKFGYPPSKTRDLVRAG
ncbi:MAG: AraC family transcriptional regulator [Xanthomonadales bacterium]|nr:AraC family transcriptional regulator [Xanthomonadales bacterium]